MKTRCKICREVKNTRKLGADYRVCADCSPTLRKPHPLCRKKLHKKNYYGRCLECRRLKDKLRGAFSEKYHAARKRASLKWARKPGSKIKTKEWARIRNQRPEQKKKNAAYQRDLRRGIHWGPKDPKCVAEKLLARAALKNFQSEYGIERIER